MRQPWLCIVAGVLTGAGTFLIMTCVSCVGLNWVMGAIRPLVPMAEPPPPAEVPPAPEVGPVPAPHPPGGDRGEGRP